MKKLFLIISLMFVAISALAYTQLTEAPEELMAFISWLWTNVSTIKDQGWPVISGFVVVAIMGIFKLLTKFFPALLDKMGNWAFVVPLALGAVGELALNFPQPFSVSALLAVIGAGITGPGLVAIAAYHVQKKFSWSVYIAKFFQMFKK